MSAAAGCCGGEAKVWFEVQAPFSRRGDLEGAACGGGRVVSTSAGETEESFGAVRARALMRT
jgi:hypothetical protein